MKNTSRIIVLILLLFSSIGFSQNKLEFGLRFMPQATTFRYTTGNSQIADFLKLGTPYYFRVRTAQGIGILYYPIKRLRIGADLLYSLQGGGYEERKTNLDYLQFPIWIGFNSSDKRKVIFTIQTGIAFSFLLNAKIKYKDSESVDISQYVTKISWGIPFAIGLKFKIFESYSITTQLYLYTDINSLAKTNRLFGVYNSIYPGIRISIDQNLLNFKRKQ